MENQNIKGGKQDQQQKNVNQQGQRPQDLESQGEQKGAQQIPSSQNTTTKQ